MLKRDSEPLEKWSAVVVVAMLQPARPDLASLRAAILPVRGVIRRTHVYTYKVVIYYCTAIETLPTSVLAIVTYRSEAFSAKRVTVCLCRVDGAKWRRMEEEKEEKLWIFRADGLKRRGGIWRGDTSCVCVSPSDRKSGKSERLFFFIRILLSFGSARIDPSAHPHPPSLHPLDVSSSFSSFHFEINSKQIE